MELNLKILSPAKINLGLKVLQKREDGYHEISSIFLHLQWGDILTFQTLSKEEFHLSSQIELEGPSKEDYLKVSEKGDITKNILYKAWKKAKELGAQGGIKIHIIKRIPTGAGLGGGSSNAASLFKFLFPNQTNSNIFSVLSSIGADVPFFWKGSHQIVRGIGEILEDIQLPKGYGVLALPELVISTKQAFLSLKRDLQKTRDEKTWIREDFPKSFASWKEFIHFSKNLSNDFEPYAYSCYPELQKLKDGLQALGFDYVSMTGTGSSFYGIVEDFSFVQEIYPKLLEKFPNYRFVQFEF